MKAKKLFLKAKSKLGNTIGKFFNLFSLNYFSLHDSLVHLFFGEVSLEPLVFYLPQELNNDLLETISASKLVTFDQEYNEKNNEQFSEEIIRKINDNLIFFKIEKHWVFEKVIEFVRNAIKLPIKSPFVIINFRGWISKPKSEKFGPNSLHKDGFERGHLKLMIYPNGLNLENGMLEVDGKLYSDTGPGFCVLFHNSDLIHRGIPGQLNNRISLEITLFRSLVGNKRINYYGKPSDRHYKRISSYYKGVLF